MPPNYKYEILSNQRSVFVISILNVIELMLTLLVLYLPWFITSNSANYFWEIQLYYEHHESNNRMPCSVSYCLPGALDNQKKYHFF